MVKKKKKKIRIKYNNIIAVLVLFVCLIGIVYSSIKILKWKNDVDENKDIQDDISDFITVDENSIDVDFEKLKSQNADTIAYLKVSGTNIDYIVVKGKDNEYYLTHNFNKNYNVAGWIFADYHNKFDGTDKNIIIYGHNMQNGSMFGSLYNVLKETWYNNVDNYKMLLITESGKNEYQVFSTYSIVSEDYYITTDFNNGIDFETFVKKIKARSIYDYGIEVTKEDTILTLSSCIGDGTKRVVLHAKLVNEEE